MSPEQTELWGTVAGIGDYVVCQMGCGAGRTDIAAKRRNLAFTPVSERLHTYVLYT
jgi:hypothetical protein